MGCGADVWDVAVSLHRFMHIHQMTKRVMLCNAGCSNSFFPLRCIFFFDCTADWNQHAKQQIDRSLFNPNLYIHLLYDSKQKFHAPPLFLHLSCSGNHSYCPLFPCQSSYSKSNIETLPDSSLVTPIPRTYIHYIKQLRTSVSFLFVPF